MHSCDFYKSSKFQVQSSVEEGYATLNHRVKNFALNKATNDLGCVQFKINSPPASWIIEG